MPLMGLLLSCGYQSNACLSIMGSNGIVLVGDSQYPDTIIYDILSR